MSALNDVLASIRERIARHQGESINEHDTKAALVTPMLNALGWDIEDLDQVRREYHQHATNTRVDYALMHDVDKPYLFVEAKALGTDLNDLKWASQILGYASVAGVKWVVLTDGNEYRIYNAHASVPVEEKLFHTIRLTEDNAHVTKVLELLARDGLRDDRLEAHWRARYVDRKVRAALEGLFGPAPDESFVNLLRKRTGDLTTGDVNESLRRVRAWFDFPAVPEVPDAPDGPSKPRQSGRSNKTVHLKHVIQAGIVRPPLDLHARYKGQRVSARIEADGTVTFRGRSFTSSSSAASSARRFVSGTPNARFPTNGWTFWQFTDADGQVKSIHALRECFLAGSGSQES